MRVTALIRAVLAARVILMLAACGGGGNGGGTPTFTVGGSVSGLSGSGLSLRTNDQTLNVSTDGAFAFPAALASGTAYNVTIVMQPEGPSQSCTATNGSGTLGAANVSNIAIACVNNVAALTLASSTPAAGASDAVHRRPIKQPQCCQCRHQRQWVFGRVVGGRPHQREPLLERCGLDREPIDRAWSHQLSAAGHRFTRDGSCGVVRVGRVGNRPESLPLLERG